MVVIEGNCPKKGRDIEATARVTIELCGLQPGLPPVSNVCKPRKE